MGAALPAKPEQGAPWADQDRQRPEQMPRECLQRLTPASRPNWPPAKPTPSARTSAMVSGLWAPRLSYGEGETGKARLDPPVAPGRILGSF